MTHTMHVYVFAMYIKSVWEFLKIGALERRVRDAYG